MCNNNTILQRRFTAITTLLPAVCINNFAMRVNVDLSRDTRNPFLRVFGQQLEAQGAPADRTHTRVKAGKQRG